MPSALLRSPIRSLNRDQPSAVTRDVCNRVQQLRGLSLGSKSRLLAKDVERPKCFRRWMGLLSSATRTATEAPVVKGCKRQCIRTASSVARRSASLAPPRVSDHTRSKEARPLSRRESDNLEFKIAKTTGTISLTTRDPSAPALRAVRER